jgi:hypothetical protein
MFPSVIRRLCSLASGQYTGGVVFSKLSKQLNQEDALSVPCLCSDCCPPHAPSRTVGILREGLIRRS